MFSNENAKKQQFSCTLLGIAGKNYFFVAVRKL